MALGKFFGKFFGRTVGDAASFAIGGSISRTIDPVLQQVENEAWKTAVAAGATRPVGAGESAGIVAEDVERNEWGIEQAAMGGIGADQFAALLGLALNAPGLGELFTLWRRGEIKDADFTHGLRKAKIEPRWDAPLFALKQVLLSPDELAVMLQRSVVPNPGVLPNQPSIEGSNVPPMPQVDIDPVVEAAKSGVDAERFAAKARIIGLPASPDLAARMHFRDIITEGAFNQAILEGNTRGEWAPFLLDGFRQILTAHDWVELHLRGYISQDEMYAGAALHGMSAEDADRLYRVLGRPLPAHQITTALARGAKFNPIPGELKDPYEAAAHESNVKPSYYEMWIANKFTYPSLFQLNALVKAGAIDSATAQDWAHKQGLAPEVVTALGTFWDGQSKPATGTPTRTYTTSAVRAISKSYIAGKQTKATAEGELTKLAVPATEWPGLFNAWDVTREATVKALSNATIRKLYRANTITQAEALAALEHQGLTAEDAALYLQA